MRQDDLSVDKELLQVALLIFSAVSLATLEFIRNAYPHIDAVQIPKTTIVYTIVLIQGVPVVMLLLADRLIAARDKSGRILLAFRATLFTVALLLILRQLQLYWGPGEDLTESVRSASPVLLVVAGLAVIAGVAWLSVRLYKGVLLFFYYMSPVAIAMTAIIPFQAPSVSTAPVGHAQEVATAEQPGSQPAVFILILDELAYDVMLKEEKLDAESFPNFAALAEEGVWFTNATSNQFRTQRSTPFIINSATALTEQFDVRLYLQFPTVENRYIGECGKEYTCRGVRYLSENKRTLLATDLALRAVYEAAPKALESVIRTPVGWLVGELGSAYPPVDPIGFQIFTKTLFDTFLNDIEGQEALGRINVLHLLLPHGPFAFNEDGEAIGTPPGSAWESYWERYRKQTMFADSLLGRLLERLKDEGIYDSSVIIVTSDHGLRRIIPSPPIVNPIEVDQLMVQVPLLIHAPGLDSQSHISDVDYQHIDFLPTFMDVLGLPPPEDSAGVSAFSRERPQRDKVFHVDDWTYVYNPNDGRWDLRQK